MFWGLVVEPGKRYEQTVSKAFCISMASLEANENDNSNVPVMLEYDNQEFILCTLHKHKALQTQLDLRFNAGDKIAFFSSGRSRVHLTGYVRDDDLDISDNEEGLEEEEEEAETPVKSTKSTNAKKRRHESSRIKSKAKKLKQEDLEDESDSDETFGLDDTEELDDDLDEDEDDDEEEESSEEDLEVQTPVTKKLNTTKSPGVLEQKQKVKVEKQMATPKSEQNGMPQTHSNKKNKKQGSMQTPKAETPKQEKMPTPKSAQSSEGTPQKKILQGGVSIEDVKIGTGPVAKSGKQVTVYYVGRLKQNNKQFDATTQGPGFKFVLGRGEVIKGWDVGVNGMRVGGKRRILCPPHMAYGKKGQPPAIPPNSHLVFDVEIKNIN